MAVILPSMIVFLLSEISLAAPASEPVLRHLHEPGDYALEALEAF